MHAYADTHTDTHVRPTPTHARNEVVTRAWAITHTTHTPLLFLLPSHTLRCPPPPLPPGAPLSALWAGHVTLSSPRLPSCAACCPPSRHASPSSSTPRSTRTRASSGRSSGRPRSQRSSQAATAAAAATTAAAARSHSLKCRWRSVRCGCSATSGSTRPCCPKGWWWIGRLPRGSR